MSKTLNHLEFTRKVAKIGIAVAKHLDRALTLAEEYNMAFEPIGETRLRRSWRKYVICRVT